MYKSIINRQLRDQQVDFKATEFRKMTYGSKLRKLNPLTVQLLRALEGSNNIRSFEISKYRDEDFIFCRTDREFRLQDLEISLNYWNRIATQYYDPYPSDVPEEHRILIELKTIDDDDPANEDDPTGVDGIELYTDDIQDVIDLI